MKKTAKYTVVNCISNSLNCRDYVVVPKVTIIFFSAQASVTIFLPVGAAMKIYILGE